MCRLKGLVGPLPCCGDRDTASGIYVALPGGAAHKPRAGVLLVVSALFMAVIGCGLLDPKRGTEAHVSGPPRKRKNPRLKGRGFGQEGDDVSGRGQSLHCLATSCTHWSTSRGARRTNAFFVSHSLRTPSTVEGLHGSDIGRQPRGGAGPGCLQCRWPPSPRWRARPRSTS